MQYNNPEGYNRIGKEINLMQTGRRFAMKNLNLVLKNWLHKSIVEIAGEEKGSLERLREREGNKSQDEIRYRSCWKIARSSQEIRIGSGVCLEW